MAHSTRAFRWPVQLIAYGRRLVRLCPPLPEDLGHDVVSGELIKTFGEGTIEAPLELLDLEYFVVTATTNFYNIVQNISVSLSLCQTSQKGKMMP
jgi:hypothetical protein